MIPKNQQDSSRACSIFWMLILVCLTILDMCLCLACPWNVGTFQVKIDPEDGTVCTYPEQLGPIFVGESCGR